MIRAPFALLALLFGVVAGARYLEGRLSWVKKVSSAVVCTLLGIALANLGVIPHTSLVQEAVFDLAVPYAIVLIVISSNFADLKTAGRHKGYGLSLVTDVLTGVMTGSLFGLSVFQDDRNCDVGHLMVVLDPASFLPRADFDRRLEDLIREVETAPPIEAEHPVMLPGEAEFRRRDERLRDGIPLDLEMVARLRELARDEGVPFPFGSI